MGQPINVNMSYIWCGFMGWAIASAQAQHAANLFGPLAGPKNDRYSDWRVRTSKSTCNLRTRVQMGLSRKIAYCGCLNHGGLALKTLFVYVGLYPESFQLIKVYIN
jgi:invasion protein IalB